MARRFAGRSGSRCGRCPRSTRRAQPRSLMRAEVDHRRALADLREVAGVLVAEGPGAASPRSRARWSRPRACPAAWRPARCRAPACRRALRRSRCRRSRRSPDGRARSGRAATCSRPARSAGAPSHSAAGEAGTPAAQMIVRAASRSSAEDDALGRAVGDRPVRARTSTPSCSSERCA